MDRAALVVAMMQEGLDPRLVQVQEAVTAMAVMEARAEARCFNRSQAQAEREVRARAAMAREAAKERARHRISSLLAPTVSSEIALIGSLNSYGMLSPD